ncbi:MAG: hypothetical protein ACT4NY_09195 [Pseudonocardiales bacterium]
MTCTVWGCTTRESIGDPVCPWCADLSLASLATMSRIYVALRIEMGHKTRPIENASRSAPDSTPPLRVVMLDLADEILAHVSWTRTWARQTLSRPGARRAPVGERFVTAVDDLAQAWDLLMARHDIGPWLASTTTGLATRGRELLRWEHLVHELSLPCPRCDLVALCRENGCEHVYCSNSDCGHKMTGQEYDHAVKGLVA